MNGFMFSPEGGVIAVVSVCMSLVSIFVRKKVINQELMKKQREDIGGLQKKVKEAQKAGDANKASESYGRLMELNTQIMKQSFKPMLFTLIPFLLVFNWMGGAYNHTMNDVVVVYPLPTGLAVGDVVLSGGGFYNQTASMFVWKTGMVEPGNWSTVQAEFTHEGVYTSTAASVYYKTPRGGVLGPVESNSTDGFVFLSSLENADGRTRVTLFYNNTKSNIVVRLGGFDIGWLGWYILCSMSTSIVLSKIFKVS